MSKEIILFVIFFQPGSFLSRAQSTAAQNSLYTGFGAYSVHHADVFSFESNPAAFVHVKNRMIGIFGERKFFLKELASYQIAGAFQIQNGHFGLHAGYFGSVEYNQSSMGIGYARELVEKIDIGVQFNYHGINLNSYGKASAISFAIGTVLHLTDKLSSGVQVNNPVGGKFSKGSLERLPSVYSAGIGYEASENFFFSLEIEKEEDQPVNVNGAFQYKLISQFLVRAGISTANSVPWFGFGFRFTNFRLDLTSSYHPQLGFSPGLLLLFETNKGGQ